MPPAPWPGGRAGWAQDCPSQSFATVVPSPWHSRFLPEANSIRQSYVSYAGNRECFFCLLSIPLTKVSGSQPGQGDGGGGRGAGGGGGGGWGQNGGPQRGAAQKTPPTGFQIFHPPPTPPPPPGEG